MTFNARRLFYYARIIFYAITMVGILGLAIWARFSDTGLTAIWKFLTTTRASGTTEDLTSLRWTIGGLFASVLVVILILNVLNRRRDQPIGLIWLAFIAVAVIPSAAACYGHYWA